MTNPQKPEIVTMGWGAHNEALYAGQYEQATSYKRARIIYIIPNLGMIHPRVYLSHRSLIFPPNQAMFPMLVDGAEVGEAYSNAIEQVLAHPDLSQWEYVLTLESDNVPPPDGVLRLLKRMEDYPEFSGIGGLYWCKGASGPNGMGVAHLWGDVSDPNVNFRPVKPRILPDGRGDMCRVYGTSMGFNMWRMEMFRDKRLPRPLFRTKASVEGVGTQDLHFANEALKLGYKFAVDCDCRVGHIDVTGAFGPKGFIW